jgi:outer membrane protein OmpU
LKSSIFATTALVATAGIAAADVSLSGSANMGYKNVETVVAGDEEGSFNHEITLGVSMSGETETGLSFGASFDVLANNKGALTNDGPGSVFISGAWGKLAMGDVGDADAQGGIADVGYDGIGIDDLAESLDATGASTIRYSHSVGPVAFSVSTALPGANREEYAIGAKYTGEGFYVGLGYSDNNRTAGAVTAADGTTTSLYVGGSFAGLKVDAMYSSRDSETGVATDDREVYGISAAYAIDAVTVTVAYSDTDEVGVDSSQGIGVAYSLGGGATLAGGIGEVNGLSRADLGLSFKF